MALASYSELSAAVRDWVQRTDSSFAARVPDFIRLGEERIWRRLRVSKGVSTMQTLSLGTGANAVNLPADFLGFRRIASDQRGGERLDYMPADQLVTLPVPGRPDVYSIEGGRLLYGRSGPAVISFAYFKHPGFLSDSQPSTWLLQDAPSIYLYAALLEAAIFIKKPQAAGEFGTLLDRAIDETMSADRAAQYSGARLRMQR